MKKIIFTAILSAGLLTATAQTENVNEVQIADEYGTKDFGGFILDMGTMLNVESLVLPPMSLAALPWETGYNDGWSPNLELKPEALRFRTELTPIGGNLAGVYQSEFYSALYPGFMNGRVQLQGATYRFNNGVRLNTYGEYDAEGYKRYNPAALPWERNNFNAAFEFKSPNGKFGIRFEVQRGRYNPY